MGAPLEKTRHPGIYKRGSRYVVRYRVNGEQRCESARTLDEARRMKSARETDAERGEFSEQSRITFREYAEEWVERYRGRGRRGFRESTRDDYRRDLKRAFEFWGDRLRLTAVTPRHVAQLVAWLCEQSAPGGGRLSDASVRRILSPVRACFATARQEGLVRHNPTTDLALPNRWREGDDHEPEQVKALTREQLAAFLGVVHPRHRAMFRLLAATGLRVSEAFALQWRHVQLDGSSPHVRVRRAYVRGRFGPPKSKHGRRDVPLDAALVSELRAHRSESEWPGEEDVVFPALNGEPLRSENVRRRALKPAAEEAGASWAGFHTFRHTCASMLFERGANAVQVQRWLGHHSPAFTLDTYVHLMDDGLGEALDLDGELTLPCSARDAALVAKPI